MTREEAALILHPDTTIFALDRVDNGYYGSRVDVVEEACRMGAEALRQTQPDAETGLVPCGCGGKPEYIISYDEEAWKNVVKVWCKKCKIHIIFKAPWDARGFDAMKEDAKKGWNTAMGYREADE